MSRQDTPWSSSSEPNEVMFRWHEGHYCWTTLVDDGWQYVARRAYVWPPGEGPRTFGTSCVTNERLAKAADCNTAMIECDSRVKEKADKLRERFPGIV